ncbi:MAG: hypothetical protein Tsb008_15180 [Rhodothalassiaceae bacterium]
MTGRGIRPVLAALALLALVLPGRATGQAGSGPQSLPHGPLIIETAAGPVALSVELADDETERATGLMYRTEMADDHGMLFDMGLPVLASFWMKNTPMALDLIFIRADGLIANIERGEPFRLQPPIHSRGRVLGVLELKAGRAAALGIAPGDLVRHPLFRSWEGTYPGYEPPSASGQ